jgi:hypothetical protein
MNRTFSLLEAAVCSGQVHMILQQEGGEHVDSTGQYWAPLPKRHR